jgi:hypothetical protein
MSDSAVGSLAGYLFQFDRALVALAKLEHDDETVSIEHVDDIATHDEDGTVVLAIQAKHSITLTGTTFTDTSYALWRTFQIWIQKVQDGTFPTTTKFVCNTNKKIPDGYLLRKIKDSDFEVALELIENLLATQEAKLRKLQAEGKSDETVEAAGPSVKQSIRLINFVLENKNAFQQIKSNLVIEDEYEPKNNFLNLIRVTPSEYNEVRMNSIYHEFYGWITDVSRAKWKQSTSAFISRAQMNHQYRLIITNPSIVSAIFRTKKMLGTIPDIQIESRRKELFVQQLEDIVRPAASKERIIRQAIYDFILLEIEQKYLITEKGDFTDSDFDDFLNECEEAWQSYFDTKVLKSLDEYSKEELNLLAVEIFDYTMQNVDVKFKSKYGFDGSNKYFRNGSFLQLSNIPRIGWNPDWKNLYNT